MELFDEVNRILIDQFGKDGGYVPMYKTRAVVDYLEKHFEIKARENIWRCCSDKKIPLTTRICPDCGFDLDKEMEKM